jgi:TatA/E family protein of Tat protein translocase
MAFKQRRHNMFGLGFPELLVILVIALLIFGAEKLPKIGESLGKAVSGFKKGMSEIPKGEDIKQDNEKKV